MRILENVGLRQQIFILLFEQVFRPIGDLNRLKDSYEIRRLREIKFLLVVFAGVAVDITWATSACDKANDLHVLGRSLS